MNSTPSFMPPISVPSPTASSRSSVSPTSPTASPVSPMTPMSPLSPQQLSLDQRIVSVFGINMQTVMQTAANTPVSQLSAEAITSLSQNTIALNRTPAATILSEYLRVRDTQPAKAEKLLVLLFKKMSIQQRINLITSGGITLREICKIPDAGIRRELFEICVERRGVTESEIAELPPQYADGRSELYAAFVERVTLQDVIAIPDAERRDGVFKRLIENRGGILPVHISEIENNNIREELFRVLVNTLGPSVIAPWDIADIQDAGIRDRFIQIIQEEQAGQ